jgi:4-amino-4-deoxy-L-arabinose transferase-like glycosyltransferase
MSGEGEAPREFHRATLPLLVLLGFAVRLGTCALKAVVASDAYFHMKLVRAALEGRWAEVFDSGYHPGYALVSAFFALFLRDAHVAAHAVSIVLGALTAIPAWRIGRRMFGERGAFFAALLAAVHPEAVDVGSDVLVEATFLFLFLSSVALVLRAALELKLWPAAAAGLLASAAFHVRPEALVLPVLAVAAIGGAGFVGPIARPRRAFIGSVACAAFLVASLPFLLHMRSLAGRWAVTLKAGGEAFSSGPKAPQGSSEKAQEEKAKKSALHTPVYFAKELGKAAYPPFVLLILAAPWGWRGRSLVERFALVALLGLVAIYLPPLARLLVAKGYLSTRHLMTPAVLLVLTGAGTLALATGRRLAVATVLVAALALPKSLRPERTEQLPLKAAGLRLAERAAPGEAVMGPEKVIYYADRPWVKVPAPADPRAVAERADAAGVRWLALLEEDAPGLAGRLDPRFELVESWGDGEDRVTLFRRAP